MNASLLPHSTSESKSENTGQSSWQIGTLTYTAVGLGTLFFLLLLGDCGWMMRERSIIPLSQLLLSKYHPSDLTTGFLFGSIPAILTVLFWPIVSVWSDRTRTRWGRRIPFLLFPTPVVTGAIVGLAYTPEIAACLRTNLHGSGSLESWVIGVFAGFWVFFEVFALVTSNIFMALVNDTVPRQLIGRFFGIWRMVGLGVGIYFYNSLIGKAEAHSKIQFICIGTAYFIAMTVMCAFVKEGSYPPPAPREKSGVFSKIKIYGRECFLNPFYRTLIATCALASASMFPVGLYSLFAAKAYGIDMELYGKAFVLTYVIGFLLAFPIGWLSDRFHPMRTGLICLISYAVCMAASYWIICGPNSFLVMFVVVGVLAVLYNTATASLLLILFPQLNFSQFYSAYFGLNQVLSLLLAPVLGRIIDLAHHDYRLAFMLGGMIALTAVALWLVVLNRGFARHGGVKSYIPPEAA